MKRTHHCRLLARACTGWLAMLCTASQALLGLFTQQDFATQRVLFLRQGTAIEHQHLARRNIIEQEVMGDACTELCGGSFRSLV